jgi:hypothetical protein
MRPLTTVTVFASAVVKLPEAPVSKAIVPEASGKVKV